MKNPFRKFFLAVLLIIMALALVLPTRAQTTPTELRTVPNVPSLVTASAVSNFSGVVNLRQDRNLAVQLRFAGSGASTANVTWWARPSVDGTNYNTHSPLIFQVAANGTTQVIGTTNIPKSVLEGFRSLEFYAISNAHGSVTVYTTNLLVGNRN